MPEGPEIKLNHDLLVRHLDGQIWSKLDIVSGKYLTKPPQNLANFQANLPSKVDSVNVHGKFIRISLYNAWIVGIGFGMTGRLAIESEFAPVGSAQTPVGSAQTPVGSEFAQTPVGSEQADELLANVRVSIVKSDGSKIHYIDPRNFGNWFLWDNISGLEKKLDELGVDLMSSELNQAEVVKLFRTPSVAKQEITQALMSQKVIAGVGNYLKAESLYRAKIYPYAIVSNLSDEELYDIWIELKRESQKSYQMQSAWMIEGLDKPYAHIVFDIHLLPETEGVFEAENERRRAAAQRLPGDARRPPAREGRSCRSRA
mgnify:CR=1 FL=1